MTRSDDPFGDLPEWKERRRLQELQQQQAYAADQNSPYPSPQDYYARPAPPYSAPDESSASHYPQRHQDSQGYQGEAYQQSPATPGYDHGYAPPAHDNHDFSLQRGEPIDPHSGPLHYDIPTAHQQSEPTYETPVFGRHPQHQGHPGHAPADGQYDGPSLGYKPPQQVSADFVLRGGQYGDDPNYRDGYGGYPNAAPNGTGGYDLGDVAPGRPGSYYDQQGAGFAQPGEGQSSYYSADSYGQPAQNWGDGAAHGTAVVAAGLGADGQAQAYDDDEEEYEDEEEDEKGFSWKLLAAVVVTGAVVAGGGVVLYDSFATGGAGQGGKAPIVRAQREPAKTAPEDAGGRKFAHQDSKLLGRLDNSTSATATASADSEVGNRVRAVPIVRVGRDGRLILPKAPEPAPAPSSTGSDEKVATAAPIAPGINVVESLNGSSPFGNLPPVTPKSEAPQAPASSEPSRPEMRPSAAAKSEARPVAVPQETTAEPVVKNRGAVNRAMAKGQPPVPTRSSVGTAWRMTGAAPAKSPSSSPTSTGIRPTIAQSVNLAPSPPTVPTTSSNASTLGATSVANSQRGGYVAVLATAPTRMKALQSFAELQQRHPKALVNRVPDVRRADLQSRGLGIMYRVVVGPAGSRNAANSVCAQLKAEGYNGCWVKSN